MRGLSNRGLESCGVRDRVLGHEPAIAPTANPEPIWIRDFLGNQVIDAVHQVLKRHPTPVRYCCVHSPTFSVHASSAVFRVQKLGLPELFETAASRPTHRIATVSDSYEGRLAQQYVVTLARQRGLNARSFRSELEAVAWLEAP